MLPAMNRSLGLAVMLSFAAIASADTPTTRPMTGANRKWAIPKIFTYGTDKDFPMPIEVGGSDMAVVDWDRDGRPDVLVYGGHGPILLRRNIGTATEPRFANIYKEEIKVFDDDRLGRFFTLIHRPGISGAEDPRGCVIGFGKHEAMADFGKKQLPLFMFVPPAGADTSDQSKWKPVQATYTDGSPIGEFADVWVSPQISTFDINGDGKEDLIVGAWHAGQANPTKKWASGFNVPDKEWNVDSGRVYVMINRSEGNRLMFDKPVMVKLTDGKPINAEGAVYPKMMDVDGDGKPDLVVGSHKPGIKWYRNVGSATDPRFEAAGEICDDGGKPIENVWTLRGIFGDLNGDGVPEMLGTSYFAFSFGLLRYDHVSGGKDLSRGWKANGFLMMQGDKDSPLTGMGICSPEVVDWNGDGVRDLLLGSEPGTPMVAINRGTDAHPVWDVPQRIKYIDGSPVEYSAIDIGRGSVWGPIEWWLETVQPRLVDWDGDGTLDIITGAMGARTLFLKGKVVDGELRFEKPVAFTNADGSPRDVAHRIQPAAYDLDGDGKLDLVDCDTDNVLTVWKGDGTTRLGPPRPFTVNGKPLQLNPSVMTATSGRRCIQIVDWNGDGVPDVITFNAFGKTVWGGYIRLNLGIQGKPLALEEAVDLAPIISHHQGGISLTDWDGDGYLDIVTGGDPSHLSSESSPRGQIFLLSGKDLPVPPAKRSPGAWPLLRAVPGTVTSSSASPTR